MTANCTTAVFIEKAVKKHGDKYDYSKVNYSSHQAKIEIFHPSCGKYFWQTPSDHLSGCGCGHCRYVNVPEKLTYSLEEFVAKAAAIHGQTYGYDKVNYIGYKTKVEILHRECGRHFWQTPGSHWNGNGCPYCCGTKKSNIDEFIRKAKLIHNNAYVYGSSYINAKTRTEIFHSKCGKSFLQTPDKHLQGQGCPYCYCSKLELETERCLINKHIKYEAQKTFVDCRDRRKLPFDFYLPELNILIECQGEQHYRPSPNMGRISFTQEESLENFKDRCRKDDIKRSYAGSHQIKLVEISYKDARRISGVLDKELLAP